MRPKEIAIVHVSGHQWVNFLDAQGNNLASKAALHLEFKMLHLTSDVQVPSLNTIFTPLEKVQLEKLSASQSKEGKWLVLDERQILSNPPFREVMTQLHWGSHQGSQVMCNATLKTYLCPQIYSLAKQIIEWFNLKKS
jgi:hypothetical protein